MRLDYRTADREPHSDAIRFRGEEWFEDAICQLGLDSRPRILNLDENAIRVLCRPDQKLPWLFCGKSHGFNGVHDQVNQYLLQLHRITLHARQIGCKFGA